MANSKTSVILNEIAFKEFIDNQLNWDIGPVSFGNLNLILGDNAQGKTRLINILKYIKGVLTGNTQIRFSSQYRYELKLIFSISDAEHENTPPVKNVKYNSSLSVNNASGMPSYEETIIIDNKIFFSRKDNTLIRESDEITIPNPFIPNHIPVLLSLPQKDFPTLGLIRSFFERMLILEANRVAAPNLDVSNASLDINSNGSNLARVIFNWQTHIPQAFQEIEKEFLGCFPLIEEQSFNANVELLPGTNISIPILKFKEKGINKTIPQVEWSDGMFRALCLLALPLNRYVKPDGSFMRPSMIIVDEVENGLDYNTASKVLTLFNDYSNLMQIALITHSPTICNMVETKNWRIAKRKASHVEFFVPDTKEQDIDSIRRDMHQDNWEFYKKHISTSPLYIVK